MPNKNILITGSNGQLGKQFKHLEGSSNNNFFYADRYQVDITNYDAIKKYAHDNNIDVVINCAAFTNVDLAESMIEETYLINQFGCKNLAKLSSAMKIKIIHISTDYVFNSVNKSFLKENDKTFATSEYGKSKLAGEKEFFNSEGSQHIIIRSGWLYSSHGKNFMNTMIKLLKNNTSINVIGDQFGTPTSCKDLVLAIFKIIENKNFNLYAKNGSIYHFSNSGYCSWYEYAAEIKKIINSNCRINKINTGQYNSVAERPKNSILKITKIIDDFGLNILPWEESLRRVLEKN